MLRSCPPPHPCWTDSTGDGVLAHGGHTRTHARLCSSGSLPPRVPQPQAAAHGLCPGPCGHHASSSVVFAQGTTHRRDCGLHGSGMAHGTLC